jgi:putative ABC transport system permease protein
MTILGMAVAALRRRRVRTVLTILSMAIAIGVFTITASVQAVLAAMLESHRSNPRVAVSAPAAGGTLPISIVDQLKKMPDVRYLYYGRIATGDDGARFKFPVIATMPHSEDYISREAWRPDTELSVKMAYEDKHWMRPTPPLLEKMHWKIGDHITVHTTVGDLSGTIIGTCSGYTCTQPVLLMGYDALDPMYPPESRNRISYAMVGTTAEAMPKLIETIDDTYANSADPTLSTRGDEFTRSNFMREVGSIPVLLEKVNLLLLAVTAIVMMSTLVVSLRERRSQFAMLRAIGFSRVRVFFLTIFESTSVCVIGGAIGTGLMFALFHSHGLHIGGWVLANVVVTARVVMMSMAVSAAIGVAIGLIPALLLTRLDIITGMEST